MSHPLLSEHPEQIEIDRAREELAQQRSAFRSEVIRAEDAHAKDVRAFEQRLSRAMGSEELAEIIEPEVPKLLKPKTRGAVQQQHDTRQGELDRQELELRARLASELNATMIDRKRELRSQVRALVEPILRRCGRSSPNSSSYGNSTTCWPRRRSRSERVTHDGKCRSRSPCPSR